MFTWIMGNLATIVVCAVLLVVTTLIVVHMVKNKKQGKTSCGCSCGDCPGSAACHK